MLRVLLILLGLATPIQPVLLTGDSLSVGTGWYLPPEWPAPVNIDATVGRSLAVGIDHLRHRSLPPLIAVSLGTNDNPADVSYFAVGVHEVLQIVGPKRCVVWATIHRPPVHGVSYAGFNRVLKMEAAHNSHFRVVDWDGLIKRDPQLVGSDGIHATPVGYRLRAALFASQLLSCP